MKFDGSPTRARSERAIVFLVGAVTFVNILDFMMVMPLGPDFATALGIAPSHLGIVGGSYTASAAVAGFAGAFFLDRFDRTKALGVLMLGLAVGTVMGAFATNLSTLLLARVIAGAFGGPASSIGLSIIADVVPAERRGRAMGAVGGAFSVASVLGVPAGLELAQRISWRAPFFAVAGIGLAITLLVVVLMPPLTSHLQGPRRVVDVPALFRSRRVVFSYAVVALTMGSSFMVIPNFSAVIQGNLHYPREHLGMLYLIGGAVSFVSMRFAGRIVDRVGSFAVSAFGAAGFAVVMVLTFVCVPALLPIVVFFPAFMIVQTTRNVSQQTLLSKVPKPHERAGFLSVQSAVAHLANAVGAMGSSAVLSESAVDVGAKSAHINGMPTLSLMAITLACCALPFVRAVQRMVSPPP